MLYFLPHLQRVATLPCEKKHNIKISKIPMYLIGMCRIYCFKSRFGFCLVFEETRIRLGMSFVWFGSKNSVRLGYYSYLLPME